MTSFITTSTTVAETTSIKKTTTTTKLQENISNNVTSAFTTTPGIMETTELLKNFTEIAPNTTTLGIDISSPSSRGDFNYLILAIVLSVVFCVGIILLVCFVTYRRGLRSRKKAQDEAQKAFQARVTSKNVRVDEIKNERGSQSGTRYSAKTQSTSSTSNDGKKDGKGSKKGENIDASGNATYQNTEAKNGTVTSEPQYVNFSVHPTNDDDLYIDLTKETGQSGPTSPIAIQSPIAKTAEKNLQSTNQQERDSTYENLQSPGPDEYQTVENEDTVPEALYQNTMQQGDAIYEQAKTDDIYVDMA
uniref:uncharacterized protein LOC120331560 n=1 Tax=Styela clava TaxID=7725 RepID=UPI0019392DC6|nr:uncharacterized protein LOC120331560 [Styela clava]